MQTIHTDQAHHSMEPLGGRNRTIPLREETIQRLDRLREAGQSYDDLVTELVNIYRTIDWSMAHGGDAL